MLKEQNVETVDESVGRQDRLTTWKNEPALSVLKGDDESADLSHKTFITNLDRWNNLLKIEGSAKPKKRQGRSSIQPKLIRRQAEWRYAPLSEPFLSSNRLFTVKPVTSEDAPAAQQNQLLLNWQFRTKIRRVNFIDNYVRSCVDEGTVFVRTGWLRITKKVEQQVPVWSYQEITTDEELETFKQAAQAKLTDLRTFDETADEAIKAAVEYFEETGTATIAFETGEFDEIEVEEVIENRPDLTIFNPRNVKVDPSCEGNLDNAKFAILSFETCKADLEKTGLYKNLDKIMWSSLDPVTDPDHASTTPTDFQFKDDARRRVIAREYWGFYDVDGSGELTAFVATWIGNTIIRMEKNPYPDQKIPLVVATYLPVKRELTGEPDAELLEDNQAVLGALMRGMIDLLGRSANSQQGTAKGFLDPLNRRKFNAGEDYEFNPQLPPDMSIVQHKYPELPQSALQMANMQNMEAESLTGVKAFSGGISGSAYGDVAAGIRGVLDASSKREMGILRRLAQGIIDIGNKIIAMNAVFLSEEEVIRVTNEEFVKIKREDLKGNFDLETDISTAEVDNQQAQDLGMILQTTAPNMDINFTKKILAKMCDLKRMPDLAEDIRNFEPQPDPLQQKMKELEIAELEAKIAEIQARTEQLRADALKKQSEADLNSLDFVEEETGTKHAREMEKTKAQARGNQQLEVTKALTKTRKPDETRPDVDAAIGYAALTDMSDDVGAAPSGF
jgi:hypothetical protein